MKISMNQTEIITNQLKLAQSASALGAGILGFGLGAKWGIGFGNYAIWIIIAGAAIHVYGMYILNMKNQSARMQGLAKALWISAWICLILLIGITVYLLL